ncbi:MAG: glutathione S-transferase [Propionibacteriaceae bacterium]|jgi:putative glutathione S-transferase|nr:glutathione S-transferase [Propionibacteriaceae bacterium]
MTITAGTEADFKARPFVEPLLGSLKLGPEHTPDGAFRRQRNWFQTRFGPGADQVPVEPGRYFLLGSLGCGWARRQHILLRLLGLEEAVPFYLLTGKDEDGWLIATADNDIRERFGFDHLNQFYRQTDPGFQGRGTSPTLIDGQTAKVVSNDYHILPQEWETVWAPHHKPGAPDLYPVAWRQEIDLLNQQLFDDVNNGTYKVIFARSDGAAKVAFDLYYARLADLDFRLATRRYLFGDFLTDSDVRLFQTLSSFERAYRPALAAKYGEEATKQIWDYPNLWAYARDLFNQGFVDDAELYFLGLIPGPSGEYLSTGFLPPDYKLDPPETSLARWQEPHGRESLTGSPLYSGPGAGGTAEHWTFA